MGDREERMFLEHGIDRRIDKLDAQLEWYADQAQEYEHAARRLDRVCGQVLQLLDQISGADSFEKAFGHLATARRLLRERHER